MVLRGDRPVTSRLSHGTDVIVRVFRTIYLEQTTFLGYTVAAILCSQCMPRVMLLPMLNLLYFYIRTWLRHCVTYRKMAGSIPYGVTGIFID